MSDSEVSKPMLHEASRYRQSGVGHCQIPSRRANQRGIDVEWFARCLREDVSQVRCAGPVIPSSHDVEGQQPYWVSQNR
jgi:hypothetical protein